MERLPNDMIDNIYSRVPVESALVSKQVSRVWRKVLGYKYKNTGLLFAYANINPVDESRGLVVQLYYGEQCEANLEQYSSKRTLKFLDIAKYRLKSMYPFNQIVGSCNGLVCLHRYNSSYFSVWNPVTGEHLLVPPVPNSREQDWEVVGFGYLPSTNEYKVVRCSCSFNESNGMLEGLVEVYTLGSRIAWRAKENIPYIFSSPGIFVNGAIHWDGESLDQTGEHNIVAYDLTEEKFKNVRSPPSDNAHRNAGDRLVLLGGNLCAVRYTTGRDGILVWAFKKRTVVDTRTLRPRGYYDHNWSWSKEFIIRIPDLKRNLYTPFAVTNDNELILWHEEKKLYHYNISTYDLTELSDDDGTCFSCIQAVPHKNTLVSLRNLGEGCVGIPKYDVYESMGLDTNVVS